MNWHAEVTEFLVKVNKGCVPWLTKFAKCKPGLNKDDNFSVPINCCIEKSYDSVFSDET